MKVAYFEDTDSMYITLRSDARYEESEEVAPGVVLDFDKEGNVLSLEIYSHAREKVDLSVLATRGIPTESRPSSTESGAASRAG